MKKLAFITLLWVSAVLGEGVENKKDEVRPPIPGSGSESSDPVTVEAVERNTTNYNLEDKNSKAGDTYINLNPTTSGTSSANPHDRQQFRDSMRDLQNANDASMRDLESNYHVDEESRLAIQLLRAKQFLNSLFQKERKAGRKVALPKSQPRQVVVGNRAAQAVPDIRGVDGEALRRENAPTGVTFRDEQGEFHYGEIDGKKFKVRVAGDTSSQSASSSRGATDLQNGTTDSTLTYDDSGANVAVYTNANAYNGGNVVSQGNVSAHAKAEQKQRIEKGAAEAAAFAEASPSEEKPKLSLADIAKQIALNGDFEEGTDVAAVAPELQNEMLDDKLIIKSGRRPAHLDLNRAPSVLDTIAVADEKDYETLASKGADWRFLFEESLREGKARFASGEGLPIPWLFLGLLTFGLAFVARRYLFGKSEEPVEAAPNIELDGAFMERAPDEILTGDQHFDQYVYVLTQKERFARNHALVTTHFGGMKEQLTPHTLYVRFDAQSNRWVIVRTDSRGNPGPAQGELQAGTVLDGEALGPSYQPGQRYELQSDGRWMKSFKEIKIVVALVVAKRQSGHY